MNFEPTSQRSPAGKAAGTARAGRWGRGPAVRGGRVPAVKSSATPPPAPGAAISTGRKGGCRQEAGGDLQPAGRRKSASSLGFGAERRRPEEIPGNGGGVPGISILCHPRGPDGPRPLAHAACPLPPPSPTPDPRERESTSPRREAELAPDASGDFPTRRRLRRRSRRVGDPDGLGQRWSQTLRQGSVLAKSCRLQLAAHTRRGRRPGCGTEGKGSSLLHLAVSSSRGSGGAVVRTGRGVTRPWRARPRPRRP